MPPWKELGSIPLPHQIRDHFNGMLHSSVKERTLATPVPRLASPRTNPVPPLGITPAGYSQSWRLSPPEVPSSFAA
ncbi:hypothetical protein J6590_068794 [Homalodisca vitripennis]|nr:hypothetical protein J6590_068794 [Homalodisca vitripennis]